MLCCVVLCCVVFVLFVVFVVFVVLCCVVLHCIGAAVPMSRLSLVLSNIKIRAHSFMENY